MKISTKHFFLLTALIVAMGVAGSAFAQSGRNEPGNPHIIGTLVFEHELQQKGYKLVAIDEDPGRIMAAELFATADQEAVKKYMPEGSAPASMSSFVFFAGEDVILFDAGLGNDLWVSKLNELVKPENVKLILLTHFHGDHIGGLFHSNPIRGDGETNRRFPNAKVRCSEQEREAITPGYNPNPPSARILAAYGEDFTTFKFDEVVYQNFDNAEARVKVRVTALDASGHTPGHTVFLIESWSPDTTEKMLILGDLLHAAALQFPFPEACARFDMDQPKAIAARKRILDFAAQEKIPVAGMHFPPPSVGIVKKNDQGGYSWESIP